ncbi:MAG: AmmeMemoRadiSam system radical SAM enzyme [Candidatus Zixiibacteriota bacterium]|nr:MAG: AmmeMemoRadiSam system radical SAM enzyme [candidate division Zixibacteria bacterium]
MNRRTFLRMAGCSAAAGVMSHTDMLPEVLGGIQNACAFDYTDKLSEVEARYYRRLDGGGIECELCPRHCRITDLERGYCGVRENRGDVYYTLVYGLPCSLNIDPIEKKPLFHFLPGTTAFSLATAGCNVNCKFCQNWEISQSRPEQTNNLDFGPEAIVRMCRARSVPSIAYTYSEPVVFFEYMYDTAVMGREQSIKSVVITGGYIEEKPLADLLSVVDAIKVDLKAIREDYYREVVRGELKPVLDRLVQMRKSGVWLEIVYLVVPTLNDSEADFRDLSVWIKNYLGTDVPVHFTRFHPQYLLQNLPVTPQRTLETAHRIAKAEGLEYVYLGNLPGHPFESTYCPGCNEPLIERRGYRIHRNVVSDARCPKCNRQIPGVF